MSNLKKSKARFRNTDAIQRKAELHFASVLEMVSEELSFVLKEDDPDLEPGLRTTAILPLSGFIELFGDLVKADDYRIAQYQQRNQQKKLGIDNVFFESLRKAGCLK